MGLLTRVLDFYFFFIFLYIFFFIAITTDHPVALIQYLPLCAGLAVKYGLPVEEGLKAITINAAKICGVEDRVGSLKEGKDADIAIFSDNPMKTFTKTLYTIIDGEIVYEDCCKA